MEHDGGGSSARWKVGLRPHIDMEKLWGRFAVFRRTRRVQEEEGDSQSREIQSSDVSSSMAAAAAIGGAAVR